MRVRTDEDPGLARVHAVVDDRRRPLGRRAGDRVELLRDLSRAAVLAPRVFVHPGAAGDVRPDAARVYRDRPYASAAQLLAQGIGEAAYGELRRTVGGLIGDADEAEHA